MASVGDRCASAFLCSFAYSDCCDLGSFSPPEGCAYAWKWPEVASELCDVKRFSCPNTDAQGVCAYRESDATVFVAFRGTDSNRDALIDVSLVKKELVFMKDNAEGVKVHSGFRQQFLGSGEFVREYLATRPDRERVMVTGHSLGGALATLCSAMLKDEDGEEKVQCIVFGCPRTGNWKFADEVDKLLSLERVVVGADPVSDTPSRIRWKHAGLKTHYLDARRVVCARRDPWFNALKLPNPLRLSDHSMSGYIDAVSKEECQTGGGDAEEVPPWWSSESVLYTCMAALGALTLVMK
nr:class 3 lipase [Oceanusvirus sp.]